jgi:NitT/TauT family transport system substrate-binding protein
MSKINIQFTLFSAFYSPLIATMAGGFLRDEGLEYEWSVSPPGVPAVASISDGSAQVVQSAPSQVHFAQVNEMDGFFITGRDADPDFSWNRLEGAKVVMFGGGQPNAMFRYACHRAGIDYNKIIALTPGGADDIDRAFRAGEGQYVQQQGPYPQQLENDGVGNIVAQVGPLIGPCAFSSLAASREWLGTDMARAFTRAYANARHYLNETPASEIAAAEQSYFPDISCWTPHVEITKSAFEVTLDVFEYTGSISERYPYERVCATPPSF